MTRTRRKSRRKCKECKKNQANKEGYCYGCHPNCRCKECKKNQAHKEGYCKGCHPDGKCKECKKNQAQKEGYCYGCHPDGKCKECNKNNVKKEGYCQRCHPDGKCKECKKNIANKEGYCHGCNPSTQCQLCHLYQVDKKRLVKSEGIKVRLCADCFYNTYPNEEVPRRFKKKQHYIHKKFIEIYGDNYFDYDRTIDGGCSKRLPDWFRDCFTHSVLFECDEGQHKNNQIICENKD